MGGRFPIINALHLSWVISLIILLFVMTKHDFVELVKSSQFRILLIFLVWTFIAMFFALIRLRVYIALKMQLSYFLLLIVSYFMFLDLRRIKTFLFVILLIHTILVLDNLDFLLSGIRVGSLRAGYFVGDGNDFAWSLTIFSPLSLYFIKESRSIFTKVSAAFMGTVILGGIILTGSRGATIAVAAVFTFLALMGKQKVLKVGFLCILAIVVMSVAPGTYKERIESIGNYQDDSSSKGRLMAWKAAIQMAIDYPLGVGPGNFPSIYGRFYREKFADHTVWAANRWIRPHSIYFLVMAEHGFLGLVLILYLLFQIFWQNHKTRSFLLSCRSNQAVSPFLTTCLQGSIVGFCAGGVFLGGLYYPAIYLLSALTLGVSNIARDRCISSRLIALHRK